MSWLLRRLLTSILLIWVVASIVFLAIRLVPGDPAELLLSQGGMAPDPAAVASSTRSLGWTGRSACNTRCSLRRLVTVISAGRCRTTVRWQARSPGGCRGHWN